MEQNVRTRTNERARYMKSRTRQIQKSVLKDARRYGNITDANILAARGVRQLTTQEKKYWADFAENARDPKQALADVKKALPETIVNDIFDNLTEQHPLLDLIDFENTEALIEMLISTSNGVAKWGELCDEITEELQGSFDVVNLSMNKLSAFLPVCKAMLDLTPEWLDRYAREILTEALAMGLETAIIDGDGDGTPIGMNRKLTGAVDGVYSKKATVPMEKLDAVTFGNLLATLSKGPNDKSRAIPRLLMVVNPTDYYQKVFPATTVRATDGSFNNNVLPYPTDIIMSAAMPQGEAIVGIADRYFMGLGTSKGGTLEYSDEYKFLEDQRIYLIKLYGAGRAKDENAFILLDITNLKPDALKVEVVNIDETPIA